MSALVYQDSPFDAIRKVDEKGNEYWLARELMPLLGYPRWNEFNKSIDRAKVACQNAGNAVTAHFSGSTLTNKDALGRNRNAQDYKLSRFACYLTAMNGDPRKPEIAAAQSYFVVKTREAETVIPQQSEEIEKLKLQLAIANANKTTATENRKYIDRLDTLTTIHGKETALALLGHSGAIVEIERTVTEVVEPEKNKSVRFLSAAQLKKAVKQKTGQTLKNLSWFAGQLRKKGRDDLLIPVTRHNTHEYIAPEKLDEAIALVYDSRQLLMGE